jgi:hypothetical protein
MNYSHHEKQHLRLPPTVGIVLIFFDYFDWMIEGLDEQD